MTVGEFTQADVDRYPIVYTEKVWNNAPNLNYNKLERKRGTNNDYD